MSESDGQRGRTKRRGVRASRIKLERALADCDLDRKTQAALANRIADLEGLDAAPKDLVSKVFRELPVDPQTLERIARGLGVDAASLYLDEEWPKAPADEEDAPGVDDPSVSVAARLVRFRRFRMAAAASLVFSFMLLGVFIALPDGAWCGVRETLARPVAADGKLGVVVARFDDDPDNRAQRYLAASLAADGNLAPYASVLATCARPRWTGPGDLQRRLARIRAAARKRLARAKAHVMVWGERDGDEIVVRFVSTRRDVSAVALEVSGRPLKVEEDRLEVRVPIGRPSEGLADVKRFVLELPAPDDARLAERREAAQRAFESSADWLRAVIVSQRNLIRTVDPVADAQRWAAINMRLCYDLRLLGDYDAAPGRYREALEACERALAVRPKERFPADWASLQVNKASSHIRLHYYAGNRADALKSLREAEKTLLSVVEAGAGVVAPQPRLTARRNLGVVYLRLGELSESDVAATFFDDGLSFLRGALDDLDPEYQPLDWAITQQNICLALYQHGMRMGGDGAPLVREAKDRCRDAVERLSPDNTAIDWAMAQNNLAAATAILAQMEGDGAALKSALDAFAAAQTVYRRDVLPENWAEVELNIGELNCNLATMNGDAARFEAALGHLDNALEVFIKTGNERYRRYAEGLAATVRNCRRNPDAPCACSG